MVCLYIKVDYLDDVCDGLKGNLSVSGYFLIVQIMDNLMSFSQLGIMNMLDYEFWILVVINLGYSKYVCKLIMLNFMSICSLYFKFVKLIVVLFGKIYC